jgi:hypothetical protein
MGPEGSFRCSQKSYICITSLRNLFLLSTTPICIISFLTLATYRMRDGPSWDTEDVTMQCQPYRHLWVDFLDNVGSSNVSQPYRPARPVTGRALLLYMFVMFVPHRKHMPPQPANAYNFIFLYVDGVHTLQEIHLWPVTGAALFLYVDNVRTLQETSLWAPTACCRDSFTFSYVYDFRTSQETHLCPVTGAALLFCMRHSCKNQRFRGTWRLHHQGNKNRWTRNNVSRN